MQLCDESVWTEVGREGGQATCLGDWENLKRRLDAENLIGKPPFTGLPTETSWWGNIEFYLPLVDTLQFIGSFYHFYQLTRPIFESQPLEIIRKDSHKYELVFQTQHNISYLLLLCVIKCIRKLLAVIDAKSHRLHLCGLSPVCVFMCLIRFPACIDS